MAKKYANLAFLYAILAMVFGVFYREFTKFSGFTGPKTNLSVMHTHYFILGMMFFLLVLVLENLYAPSEQKWHKGFFLFYNIGLNVSALGFFVRGFVQVLGNPISKGLDASISGVAGTGHAFLGFGIILYFVCLRKQIAAKKT